jgi:hypothetical protein
MENSFSLGKLHEALALKPDMWLQGRKPSLHIHYLVAR